MQKYDIDSFISYGENETYPRADNYYRDDFEFFLKEEHIDDFSTNTQNQEQMAAELEKLSLAVKLEDNTDYSNTRDKEFFEETKERIDGNNVFRVHPWDHPRNENSPPAHMTSDSNSHVTIPAVLQLNQDISKRRAESKMRYNQNAKRVHVKSPKQSKDLESYDPDRDLSIGDTPTQSEFSEALTERRKTTSRLSASKRYPQQVIVGFGRHIVRQHEKLNDPFDKKVVNFVKENILGKSDQTYKISTIKDIRRIFQRVPVKDTPDTISVKDFLIRKFREFFKDGSYFIWLKKDYRGEILNKVWLAINKKSIEERFFEDKAPGFNSVARDVPDLEEKFYQLLDHKLETIEAKA
jgi:hypothetical protein